MKALILYFSGTGNTRYVAEKLRGTLVQRDVTVELHSLEEGFSPASYAYDLLLLGFPKYYENPVLSVLEDLRHILPRRETNIPTMAFCTQASTMHTDFSGLEKLLRAKNHRLTVAKSFSIANNMGFKEDIETILCDVPEQRQIVLFSATVPDDILSITRQFQKDPVQIEICRDQITLENIAQSYVDVPMLSAPLFSSRVRWSYLPA